MANGQGKTAGFLKFGIYCLIFSAQIAIACIGIETSFHVNLLKETTEGAVVQIDWQQKEFGNPNGKKGSLEILDDDGFLSYYLAYVRIRDGKEEEVKLSSEDPIALNSLKSGAARLKSYISDHVDVLGKSEDEKLLRQKILSAADLIQQLTGNPEANLGNLEKLNKDLRYYSSSAAYKTRLKGSDAWGPSVSFNKLELPSANLHKDLSCKPSIADFQNENNQRGLASER